MNIERLNEIARWLEAGAPHVDHNGVVTAGFAMQNIVTETNCGSICCIAGAANQFFGDARDNAFDPMIAGDAAAALLGLNEYQADFLFFPDSSMDEDEINFTLRQVTPKWAARCIRNLIATGEVDWIGTRQGEGA